MTVEHWERRFNCALGMAIYIHLTSEIWYGMFSIFGITICMVFAFIPAIEKRFNKKETK